MNGDVQWSCIFDVSCPTCQDVRILLVLSPHLNKSTFICNEVQITQQRKTYHSIYENITKHIHIYIYTHIIYICTLIIRMTICCYAMYILMYTHLYIEVASLASKLKLVYVWLQDGLCFPVPSPSGPYWCWSKELMASARNSKFGMTCNWRCIARRHWASWAHAPMRLL